MMVIKMIFSRMIKKIQWVNIVMTIIILCIVLRLGYSQFFAYQELSLKATESWQRSFPIRSITWKNL